MGTIYWRGDATAVAKVMSATVTGTWATNDWAKITINGKSITFTVGATQTIAAVVAGLVSAWNNSSVLEHAEVTAADASPVVTLTADAAGVDFVAAVSCNTAGDGDIAITTTTANAGPEDLSTAANYSGGALPTDGDTLVFERSAKHVKYGLDALDDLTSLTVWVKASYTGQIGLPLWHTVGQSGYLEYRPRYFDAGITVLKIGEGEGRGSGRLYFNFHTVQTAATIFGSAQSVEEGVPAICLIGSGANSTLAVLKGTVGAAIFAAETATFATVTCAFLGNQNSDSKVYLGAGCTLTTVVQTGGYLEFSSNVTTLTQNAGSAKVLGAATIGTATVYGTVVSMSTGTVTTLAIKSKSGVYDRRTATAAQTITNAITMDDGSQFHDPYATVTASGGWTCDPEQVTLNLGRRTLSLAA